MCSSDLALLQTVWRERWAWAGFAALEAAGLWNFYTYYYMSLPKPTAGQMFHYLWMALVQSFVPALFGVKYPESGPGGQPAVIVLCALLAVVLVFVALRTRPRAWRCLAAFVLVFAVTMAPVGLNRVGREGVSIGHELYYEQSLQFMFLLLAALAEIGRAHV